MKGSDAAELLRLHDVLTSLNGQPARSLPVSPHGPQGPCSTHSGTAHSALVPPTAAPQEGKPPTHRPRGPAAGARCPLGPRGAASSACMPQSGAGAARVPGRSPPQSAGSTGRVSG